MEAQYVENSGFVPLGFPTSHSRLHIFLGLYFESARRKHQRKGQTRTDRGVIGSAFALFRFVVIAAAGGGGCLAGGFGADPCCTASEVLGGGMGVVMTCGGPVTLPDDVASLLTSGIAAALVILLVPLGNNAVDTPLFDKSARLTPEVLELGKGSFEEADVGVELENLEIRRVI